MNPSECPECGSLKSKPVWNEWREDRAERTLVCEMCPTEWTVVYADPIRTEIRTYES